MADAVETAAKKIADGMLELGELLSDEPNFSAEYKTLVKQISGSLKRRLSDDRIVKALVNAAETFGDEGRQDKAAGQSLAQRGDRDESIAHRMLSLLGEAADSKPYKAALNWFLNAYSNLGDNEDAEASLAAAVKDKKLAKHLLRQHGMMSGQEMMDFNSPSFNDSSTREHLDKWFASYKG